ncbi:MAG TPA: Gmad2 immunoglobulin-like domain-containing protein [Patescibacteria group bacterium]|nr:Gmad2 immunoglobulin-like domain-containing protein [Patescibacteria group bacterium]
MENNKRLIIGIVVAFIVIIGGFILARGLSDEDTWICENGTWIRHGNPTSAMPTEGCGEIKTTDYEGVIKTANNNSLVISIPGGEDKQFSLAPSTVFIGNTSDITAGNDLKPGFTVNIRAEEKGNERQALVVTILKEVNIFVTEPKPGDEIGLPVTIKGEARVFENTFNYRIKDKNGKILWESFGMTEAPDAGIFGAFTVETNYSKPATEEGTIEVFEYSPKDGGEENMVIVPVRFAKVEEMVVKVFLSNRKSDPNFLDCGKVSAVLRRVPKTTGVARAALEELLRGVARNEAELGYFSNIPFRVSIKSLVVENGVAKVDFSKELEPAGGSCLVTAIRAQIEQTLKQFPTVTAVEISINGNKEDILQP